MNKLFNYEVDFSKFKWYEILRSFMLLFIVYAFLGWVYEEFVFLIEDSVLVNRGFLFGPWLPIYGTGGLFILLVFYRFKNKKVSIKGINIRPLLLFIYSVLIATLVELIATYIIDFSLGDFKVLWDYSDNFLNFQGRIALVPDLKFGVLAIVIIYFFQPFLNKVVFLKNKYINVFSWLLILIFVFDVVARFWLGNNYIV